MRPCVPEQLLELQADLQRNPAITSRILRELEQVEIEPERIIRCNPENIERAICRAFARCREWGQFWKVEVVE